MTNTQQTQQVTRVLKALADDVRLSIVRKLAREDGVMQGCDIVACASVQALSQPAMSHHFAKLVESGVVVEHKRGTQKAYQLNGPLLDSIGINVHKL